MEKDYISINKKAWNDKTPYHVASAFYNMPAFLNGKSSLQQIELELLGGLAGKKVLHLQCHFGQDTLSMARMGAEVTGVDLSDEAINQAKALAGQLNIPAQFICCDVYDLPNNLDDAFDIVFTSYGTIGWLPDLDKWAAVINRFLKPGGTFVFAEFHPVVWMFDVALDKIQYNYFKGDAIIEVSLGSYADVTAPIENETISWNHSLAEVINSLINTGLAITRFNEYDYSPYNCFTDMEEFEAGKYRFAKHGNKVPLVYALTADKKL